MTDVIDTAVLLVAGIGSRLRPLTDLIPKALVKVGGISILERAVSTLRSHGVRRFVFATGYRQEAVQSTMGALGIDSTFCHNPRFDETQNSISLLHCQAALAGKGFFKLDGDVLFDGQILDRLNDAKAPLLAVAVDGARQLDGEAMKVTVGPQGKIKRFGKQITVAEAHAESIGIERIAAPMSNTLFEALAVLDRAGIVDRYYEDVYSELIANRQIDACAVEVGDLSWTEVDDRADLERAALLFGQAN